MDWMFWIIVMAVYYILFRKHIGLRDSVYVIRRGMFRGRAYMWVVCVFYVMNCQLSIVSLNRQNPSARVWVETIGIYAVFFVAMIVATIVEYRRHGEGVFEGGCNFGGMAHTWDTIVSFKTVPGKKEGVTVLILQSKDKRGRLSTRNIRLADEYIPQLKEALSQYV